MSSETTPTSSSAGLETSAGKPKPTCELASTADRSGGCYEEQTRSATPSSPGSVPSVQLSSLLQPISFADARERARAPKRVCKGCEKELPIHLFVRRGDYRDLRCNKCRVRHEASQVALKAKKDLIEHALAQPCADCHQRFEKPRMVFERVSGLAPEFPICAAYKWASMGRLKQLLTDHVAVCANCREVRRYNRRHRILAEVGLDGREVRPADSGQDLPLQPSSCTPTSES